MFIVADIGGTKMRIARSDDAVSFAEPIITETPAGDDALVAAFERSLTALAGSDEIRHVVIGKPLWKSRPGLEERLRAAAGSAPVEIRNDAALVGLGEAHAGAGRGARIFAYITISTGVNGVRTVDGIMDESAAGFEIGGQYLTTEGTVSWEELISGTAVEKRFGVKPRELGADHPVWEELARTTAYGLHNTILHWSPQRVALGGSMLNEVGIPIDRVREHLTAIMRKFATVPEVVHSELRDLGGLHGGLALIRQLRG